MSTKEGRPCRLKRRGKPRTDRLRELRPAVAISCLSLLLIVGAIIGDGCTTDTTAPKSEDKIALFGYLYVGEPMVEANGILVTRTRPVDQFYNPSEATVRDARMTLWQEGSSRIDTLRISSDGDYYFNPQVVIDSVTTYHLQVIVDGTTITATTTTPNPFRAVREPLRYPLTMVHSEIASKYPIVVTCSNPEQIFLVDVYCREDWRTARYVYTMGPNEYPQSYDEYGGDNGQPRHIFAYFRAKNLETAPDGYLISFYGDMMAFYGEYDVGCFAIDQNYYNFLYREHPELSGGVNGGIGVFGSAFRRTYQVKDTE